MNKQLSNRTVAHITRIEFAPIQESHVIVRITCRTSRPLKDVLTTHVVIDHSTGGKPGVRGIQDAISALREEYNGTKIALDPDAELLPMQPLAKWRYDWEEPLYRASLGLNWQKDFSVHSSEIENLWILEADDHQWVRDHANCEAPIPKKDNAARPADKRSNRLSMNDTIL